MNKFYLFILLIIFNIFSPNPLEAAFFENNSNFVFLENFFLKKQKYLIFLIFFLPSIHFFKKRNFLLFSFFVLCQFFIILYWSSLILWLRDLAGDSLSEVNTLNIYFIFSWLVSIFKFLKPNLDIGSFFKFYLIGFLLYFLIRSILKKKKNYLINFSLILSFFFIFLFINFNISHLIGNIATQKDIKKNFTDSDIKYLHTNKINLILFIGESNSLLNSNHYIEQLLNKKEILKKGKFQYYKKIYSTHTHSTPALLRLLSVPNSNKKSDFLVPIVNQKRTNIFSFFDKRINKSYISSTGINGFNNIHYSVFFENFHNKFFLNESNHLYEKEFFLKKINNIFMSNNINNLIVLHSSVGHAPYQKFIPKNISYKNELYTSENLIKLIGNNKQYLDDIVNYEKALKYNFDNLENVISIIDDSVPTVLVYLSDHGESVFTGNGHDSSRLVHEMLRIPFLIFYNNRFVEKHNNIINLHEKFKDKINTTDILKEIIFNIYSLDVLKNKYVVDDNAKFQNIIFQRNKKKIIELIDLNIDRVELPDKFELKDEKDTTLHLLSDHLSESQICYHAANTIVRIKRALQITSCLEFDLVVEEDELFIYHPPNKNIKFTLDELFDFTTETKSLWIDAKNINIASNCNTLYKKIKELYFYQQQILVEFPSNTPIDDISILSCINNFRSANINVSYYISNDDINNCYINLIESNKTCKNLIDKVSLINKKKIFNNISFDYKFSKILKRFNFKPTNLRLNTWHINFDEVKDLDLNQYNLVIPYNSSHNKNTL